MKMISKTTGLDWQIEVGKHLIGRGPFCGYTLDFDTVSREHAELEVLEDGRVFLTDKGSRNGTFVNNVRIRNQMELHPLDFIKFGGIEFQFAETESENLNPALDGDGSTIVTLPMRALASSVGNDISFAPRAILGISDLGKMLVVPGAEIELFERALRLLRDIIPFSRAAIFLFGNDSELKLAASQTDEKSTKEFNISNTVINEVRLRKNAILILDALADPHYARQDSIIAGKTRTAMAVPLLYEDKFLGAIYVDSSDLHIAYSEDSLRVAVIFANILASKTANYNYLKELKEKEILESEMAIASQIQRGLLPRELPSIERYYINAYQDQCRQVGGDLYDIAKLKDGRINFIIADVSGKGMGAALLASNILASFRILYDSDTFDLLNSIRLVSDQFLRHSGSGDFATLFAGTLDPVANTFQFINAGHNSPVLVRCNGTIRNLESSGIPIGILGNQLWKAESIELDKGDFIFAFTDGITEAENIHGEQFGEERLIKLLCKFAGLELSGLHARLEEELGKFLSDSSQIGDDVTMFIIKRES